MFKILEQYCLRTCNFIGYLWKSIRSVNWTTYSLTRLLTNVQFAFEGLRNMAVYS